MRIHRLELLCSALLAFGLSTAHGQEPAQAPVEAAPAPAEPAGIGEAAGAPVEAEQPREGGLEEAQPREEGGVCASDERIVASFEQQATAIEGVTELVSAAAAASRADLQGLAANLTVRGNIDSANVLSARIVSARTSSDVRDGFAAQGAALVELNAKADLLVGSDDSPGLSDIYDAASKAANGGDTCANNCSSHGVCQFGRCFASAEGIDDLDGTVQATRAELEAGMARVGADLSGVEAALATQGALVELNQGGLEAVQADVAALRTTMLRSEARAMLIGDNKDLNLAVSLEVAAQVVAMAAEDHALLLEVDVRGRGRGHKEREAAALLAAAEELLNAGQPLKAVVAARLGYSANSGKRRLYFTRVPNEVRRNLGAGD